MKIKHVFLALLTTVFSLPTFAQQNGVIRPAAYPPANNTGSAVNWVQIATGGVKTTTDTVFLYPYGGQNIVQPADSNLQKIIYVIKNKPSNYTGDEMQFIIAQSRVHRDTVEIRNAYNVSFKFIGADSTIKTEPGKYYYSKFIYNGSYWLQTQMDTLSK